MIGNNVTWSTVWGTVCNENYGDCGYGFALIRFDMAMGSSILLDATTARVPLRISPP